MHRAGFSPRWHYMGRFFPRIDLIVHRLSNGRFTMSRRFFGFPTIVLVHTGRGSGREHRTPVSSEVFGDGWAVGDGNFGLHRRPDWSKNLAANPEAVVELDGQRTPVHARRATEDERQRLRPRFFEAWPAARAYEERAGRDVWIWVLDRRTR
jgi:deazaflavin-dependent oxidoreductase (nitroreductase family)